VEYGYWPACSDHYEMLEYTDMMNYFYDMSFGSHATAHTTLGSVYGCDAMREMLELGFFDDEVCCWCLLFIVM
jgi:hypothetical protein